MSLPLGLTMNPAEPGLTHKLRANERYPLVLMLEPTELCNLTRTGCGTIRQAEESHGKRLSAEECFQAVDEFGAQAVSS